MRAMRGEQGEAMLRCDAMRGEGKRGDASDARRSIFGVLRRGEGLRGDACEAMRAVRGEASDATVCIVVRMNACVYKYMVRANALAKLTLWPENVLAKL